MLRNRTFFSLHELREAVKVLVTRLNDRPMQQLKKSRRELFEEIERATLAPLPVKPYEFAEWAKPRVHIDYHVQFDEHFYSVPYQLVGEQLELRASATTVELLRGSRRITSHARSFEKHRHTTKAEHMPRGHRDYAEWTPPRLVAWAKSVGPATAELVASLMSRHRHPQQGFRPCLGVMRLRDTYSDARIEAACSRAVTRRACSYASVVAILKNNLDGQEEVAPPQQMLPLLHGNLRGRDYYH